MEGLAYWTPPKITFNCSKLIATKFPLALCSSRNSDSVIFPLFSLENQPCSVAASSFDGFLIHSNRRESLYGSPSVDSLSDAYISTSRLQKTQLKLHSQKIHPWTLVDFHNHFLSLPSGAIFLLLFLAGFFGRPFLAPQAFGAALSKSGVPAISQTELLSSGWTGFLAGCLHTLSGPDHLAALAPLSIGRTSWESMAVGTLWGLGHDAGQVVFGLIFLILKDRLHIEVIRSWGTQVVGLTLLLIGGLGIREATEVPNPCVLIENGDPEAAIVDPTIKHKKKIGFATFATGIVHGFQPDALMMVLPALALPSRSAGAAFLVMFLLGTVVAMGSYTVFIGSCCQVLKDRIPRITEKLTWFSSLVALGLGGTILICQFFGFSLY